MEQPDYNQLIKRIRDAEELVALTPTDHPDRAGRLHNLGAWLARR